MRSRQARAAERTPAIAKGSSGPAPAPSLLDLQRKAGNAAVNRLLAAPPSPATGTVVRRLLSSTDLRKRAGAESKDATMFGKTVRKRSTEYKSVLAALDSYERQSASLPLGRTKPQRLVQAVTLRGELDKVIRACDDYLTNSSGNRGVYIQNVRDDAVMEKDLVGQIAIADVGTDDQLIGTPWLPVIADMSGGLKHIKSIMQDTATDRRGKSTGAAINTRLFHGTASPFLGKTQGELLSGKSLQERGVNVGTGEGDFFSKGGGGAKDFVSVGEGAPGLGTGLAYAQAVTKHTDYNPALYTDEQLGKEIAQIEAAIDNWRDDFTPAKDDFMGMKKSKEQFKGLLIRLQKEEGLRLQLPKGHPRRQGKPYSDSVYPLMFEFDGTGVDRTNPRPDIDQWMDLNNPRAIGGERNVPGGIDFRAPSVLRAVWCPLANVNEVRTKVGRIVGNTSFTVVPMELAERLPNIDVGQGMIDDLGDFEKYSTAARFTQQITMDLFVTQYEKVRKLALTSYSEAMTTGKKINDKSLAETSKRLKL